MNTDWQWLKDDPILEKMTPLQLTLSLARWHGFMQGYTKAMADAICLLPEPLGR